MSSEYQIPEEKGKKSRCLVVWWRCFIVLFTAAILGTTGGLVGYYIAIESVDVTEDSFYYVGVSRHDVTGPIVQINMMGYAHPEQIADGLHTRLYSRAYVIADASMKNRVAFVSFDGGMTSQLMKLEVVKRLREKHGEIFNEKNVVISGTHTHSGPGGFFQFLLFEVTSLGHDQQSTETIINGIVRSIEAANSNLRKARLRLGKAKVDAGNINRSPTSYLRNPAEERARYPSDTDQEITVLRFDSTEGEALGMVSWYPVHPTSMNFSNLLINSDNKGRASMLFENMMRKEGENATGKESFVAAFASANLGDVSPRTNGPICVDTGEECEALSSTCDGTAQNCVGFGPGVDMFDSTDKIARRQFEAALKAFNGANDVIEGPISWVHQYVDMPKASASLEDGSTGKACPPGMGYSFAAGCTDGAGGFNFVQGMTNGTKFWDIIRDIIGYLVCSQPPTDDYYECHQPKPVLLPTGHMDKPYDWHPTIVDVQLLRVGQLLIAAVPGEYSTMAGRRLVEGLNQEALIEGMPNSTKIVIAGLSNVYTHYITTPEEYQAQRYEAASVIFGINTFAIYQEKYKMLLRAMLQNKQDETEIGPQPEISHSNQSSVNPLPGPDKIPDGVCFGEVIDDVNMTYAPGDVVTVKFQGANPRHNMKIGSTYLKVQRDVGGVWVTQYTDADWSTRLRWNEANNQTSKTNDVTLFSALFDVIADVTGLRFDFAASLKFQDDKSWLDDVFHDVARTDFHLRKKRLFNKLRQLDLLRTGKKVSKAESSVESHVIISWEIPFEQPTGSYRVVYFGDHMTAEREVIAFTGVSSNFTVTS